MDAAYKITTQPSAEFVTLLLNGKFSEEALEALDESISAARCANQQVVMDLSEVTLVDRKAVQYLVDQTSHNVRIVNCPVYLRRWIAQVSDED
jgi:ABC-type transporter Mla MlaB component